MGAVSPPPEQREVTSLWVEVEVYFHLTAFVAAVVKLSPALSEAVKASLSFEICSLVLQEGAFAVACSRWDCERREMGCPPWGVMQAMPPYFPLDLALQGHPWRVVLASL